MILVNFSLQLLYQQQATKPRSRYFLFKKMHGTVCVGQTKKATALLSLSQIIGVNGILFGDSFFASVLHIQSITSSKRGDACCSYFALF